MASSAATFRKEIEEAINRCSMENGSNTADFILAKFLCACLEAFDAGAREREAWYGRSDRPGARTSEGAPAESDLAEAGARPQADCSNCRGIDLPAMSNDAHGAGQEGAVADVITYLREIGAEEPALAIETGEWHDVVTRAKARETPAPEVP